MEPGASSLVGRSALPPSAQRSRLRPWYAVEVSWLRLRRLDAEILRLLPDWSMAPVVEVTIGACASVLNSAPSWRRNSAASPTSATAPVDEHLGVRPRTPAASVISAQGVSWPAALPAARRARGEREKLLGLPATVAEAKLALSSRQRPSPCGTSPGRPGEDSAPLSRAAPPSGSSSIAVVAVAREMAAVPGRSPRSRHRAWPRAGAHRAGRLQGGGLRSGNPRPRRWPKLLATRQRKPKALQRYADPNARIELDQPSSSAAASCFAVHASSSAPRREADPIVPTLANGHQSRAMTVVFVPSSPLQYATWS